MASHGDKAKRFAAPLGVPFLMLFAVVPNAPAAGETLRDVVFTEYSERSSGAVIARRMLSPSTMADLNLQAKRTGKTMVDQSIDLADEKFLVYLPAHKPATVSHSWCSFRRGRTLGCRPVGELHWIDTASFS